MSQAFLYIGNTNILNVKNLRTVTSTGTAYINNSTSVEATLQDSDGNEIANQSWPLKLTYISGSTGVYDGVVENDIDVDDGDLIWAIVDVTAGSVIGNLRLLCTAIYQEVHPPY
jgi:hypothetical protein